MLSGAGGAVRSHKEIHPAINIRRQSPRSGHGRPGESLTGRHKTLRPVTGPDTSGHRVPGSRVRRATIVVTMAVTVAVAVTVAEQQQDEDVTVRPVIGLTSARLGRVRDSVHDSAQLVTDRTPVFRGGPRDSDG